MRVRLLVLLPVGVISAFAGAAISIAIHGDWLMMRSGKECVAYDPNTASLIGKWTPSADGRCHFSKLLLGELGL